MAAVKIKNCLILKLLIERGADLELKDKDEKTALHWAVTNSCPLNAKFIMVSRLVEAGADPTDILTKVLEQILK